MNARPPLFASAGIAGMPWSATHAPQARVEARCRDYARAWIDVEDMDADMMLSFGLAAVISANIEAEARAGDDAGWADIFETWPSADPALGGTE